MELYLVQHGEARPEAEDPGRGLTEEGAESAKRMGEWAAGISIHVDQVRHSGKRRAQQTAQLLAEGIAPIAGVIQTSGLKPNDDVGPVAEDLTKGGKSIMLVGHLPFLSRLASLLLVGDAAREVIRFRNAGIVCLGHEEDLWSLSWSVTPDLIEPSV